MKKSPPTVSQEFTSIQLMRHFKISLRQLQWWDEKGVVRPRHEGHRRYYDVNNTRLVSAITCMRKSGLSLQKVRRIISYKSYLRRLIDNQFSIVVMDRKGVAHIRNSWEEFELLVGKYSRDITVAVVRHA